MSTLRLFITDADLAADDLAEVTWRLLDGTRISHGRSRLSALPKAARCELFLPASAVLRATTQLPPGGKRQARKLLPFALDNVLLGDPAQQHLAYTTEGDKCRVAAIDKALLGKLLGRLAAHGVKPRSAWSIADLLPVAGTHILHRPGGWVAVRGETAHWIDDEALGPCPPLLAAWLMKASAPAMLYIEPGLANQLLQDSWQIACPVLEVDTQDALVRPLSDYAIDLLQGEFAVGAHIDLDWTRLRVSAWLAACILLAVALNWLGSTLAMRAEEKALRQTMNNAFQTAFPGEPLVDAKLQLQGRLQQGPQRALADGLSRLQDVTTRLASSGEAPLTAIDYRDDTLLLDYKVSPTQASAMVAALGAHYVVTRSTPAPGTERLSIKARSGAS